MEQRLESKPNLEMPQVNNEWSKPSLELIKSGKPSLEGDVQVKTSTKLEKGATILKRLHHLEGR